jgi:hypothetical protein
MPTFAPGYVKPGAYLQQEDISNPALLPGVRIFTPIGQGAKTLMRRDTLTKGVVNGQDGPLAFNIVINLDTIIDSNSVIYQLGRDFKLTRPTADTAVVDWSPKASLVGLTDILALLTATPDGGAGPISGTTLRLVINGGTGVPAAQFVDFSGPFPTPASVAAFINSWDGGGSLLGVASINAQNQLVLSANSVLVDEGTSNSVLGFTAYASDAVLEPAPGIVYDVYYTSDKLASEYRPIVWTDMNKVVAWYGQKQPRTTLDSGTATAAAPKSFSDNSKTWVADQFVGNYLKITSGTGAGQVRVIIANDTAGNLTLSQDWNSLSTPDTTSQYIITDVNDNSISMGTQVGMDIGATVIIASQYADDIFNDTNIKAAIDALEQDIMGQRPYCLVLMRGLGSTEVGPVAYLKQHVETMSNTINNKWRMAIVGLAQGNDDYLSFVTMATGTNSDRMVILSNTAITRDFGFGVVQLDGSYFAAAHGGLVCRNEESSIPLLFRSISAAFDVSLYSDPFLEVEKNLMGAAGVTIYERRGVDLICRDALNTKVTTILSQETKLTRSKDYVSQYLRGALEASLVGQRFITSGSGRENVLVQAKSLLDFLFADLLARGTITRVANVSVKQDPIDPRQLDITADIFLTTDVKWVFILAGFGV